MAATISHFRLRLRLVAIAVDGDDLGGETEGRGGLEGGKANRQEQQSTDRIGIMQAGELRSSSPTFAAGVGLHSVYMRAYHDAHGPDTPPEGLFLVVNLNSQAVHDWLAVPEAFRKRTDPMVVQERRNYLLDLYSRDKQ